VVLAIRDALAGCYVQLRVGEDESCSSTIEKRRVVEGFGELGERFAGFDYYATGVILSFRVGVDGELGELAFNAGFGAEKGKGGRFK